MMVSQAWITAIKRWFSVAMASGNSVMKIMPSALAAPTRTVLNVYLVGESYVWGGLRKEQKGWVSRVIVESQVPK